MSDKVKSKSKEKEKEKTDKKKPEGKEGKEKKVKEEEEVVSKKAKSISSEINIEKDDIRVEHKEYDISKKEKCEGCLVEYGSCYCTNCEKIFCKICEDQIHKVPTNRFHERVSVNDVYHLKKLCYHHGNILKLYCESCEEPICNECQLIGPHNSKLHRISNVFDSFKKKYNHLTNLINKNLLVRLDQLTANIQHIEMNIDEIKSVKGHIERDIRTEFSNITEHLRSEEGKKLAILQYESSILHKEMNKIEDIINDINEVNYNETPDMIAFLLKYKQLLENIELCLSKQIKRVVEVRSDDFPRVIEDRRYKLHKYEKMKKLLKIKDDLIWNLVIEKRKESEREIQALKEKHHNEISEWVKLSDAYKMQLLKLNMVCHFCGCFVDEFTINSPCTRNCAEENKGIHSNSAIPIELINSKRHYFCIPKEINLQPESNNINNHQDKLKIQGILKNNLVEDITNNLNNTTINKDLFGTFNSYKNFNSTYQSSNNLLKENINYNNVTNINNPQNTNYLPVNNITNKYSDIRYIIDKIRSVSNKQNLDVEFLLQRIFNDKLYISKEILKNTLSNNFGLDDNEVNILFRNIEIDNTGNISFYPLINLFKKNLDSKNIFENNIYNSRYVDDSLNQPDWVSKISILFQTPNLNLISYLMNYDNDNDSYVRGDDIRIALVKLNLGFTTSDIDNMMNFMMISSNDSINIIDFTKGLRGICST